MLPKYRYDVFIFDCDGVILDSNKLKIEAMKNGLQGIPNITQKEQQACLDYFRNNFGKSRYHHVDYFFEHILSKNLSRDYARDKLLHDFSSQCSKLYTVSEFTAGFQELLKKELPNCYVASGSDQNELRSVFKKKGIAHYFCDILGSPTPKKDNVEDIMSKFRNSKALMIGDSKSDFLAAEHNHIDFAGYTPYSNTPDTLIELSKEHDFATFDCWKYFHQHIA